MLVCSFVSANRTRDRGCSKHPVFPAPSVFDEGGKLIANLGRKAPRDREVILRAVGWAKERSDVPTIHHRARCEMVGTLRFAHPTAASYPLRKMLPQPQLPIPLRRHLVAPCAIRRRAAAVAGDDAGLLAFDIGIDAGHPGIDLVGQHPLAER